MVRGAYLPVLSLRAFVCITADISIIIGTALFALWFRLDFLGGNAIGREVYLKAAVLAPTFVLFFYYNNLYTGPGQRNRLDLFVRIGKSFVACGILLALLYYAVPSLAIGRGVFVIHFPLSLLSILLWRSVYYWAILNGSLVEKVLILGTGETAQETARTIQQYRKDGYHIAGFLSECKEAVGQQLIDATVLGTFDKLPFVAKEVDTVVVAVDDRRGKLPLRELLRCKLEGVRVEEAASFYESLTGQIPVRSLRPSWLIFSQGFEKSRMFRNSRRVIEFVIASTVFVFTFPLILLAALLVWLESGRPILYRQSRVGEQKRAFVLYKLRTMRQDAEEATGAVWAAPNGDPRITRVGRFLRASRIDEVPQLVNVLRGEMSFVGPRPERPCFVNRLQSLIPYYQERHSVKPGITGWAQVRYQYSSTVEEAEIKLRYDLYYIKHMSVWLDLIILLDTAKIILFGRGAR